MTFNKRFNRNETASAHYYSNRFGDRPRGSHEFDALLKCRLVHGAFGSIIVPELIVLDDGQRWMQPLGFSPPVLLRDGGVDSCRIWIDVSGGNQVLARFATTDFVTRYEDGAELYRCALTGPVDLLAFASGSSEVRGGNRIYLTLYHHTSEAAQESIVASQEFWSSAWNIQGSKKLTNIAYVYFTWLDKIVFDEDLRRIAMASDETIYYIVDNFEQPPVLTPALEEALATKILPLKVYRGSTLNRRHTVTVKVDAATVAINHILLHQPDGSAAFFEIASPYIHRVGVDPGAKLPCPSMEISAASVGLKRFEYAVVGDATKVDGLRAPFDEEETSYVLKLEHVASGSNMLAFWFEHPNTDQFTGKNPETSKF